MTAVRRGRELAKLFPAVVAAFERGDFGRAIETSLVGVQAEALSTLDAERKRSRRSNAKVQDALAQLEAVREIRALLGSAETDAERDRLGAMAFAALRLSLLEFPAPAGRPQGTGSDDSHLVELGLERVGAGDSVAAAAKAAVATIDIPADGYRLSVEKRIARKIAGKLRGGNAGVLVPAGFPPRTVGAEARESLVRTARAVLNARETRGHERRTARISDQRGGSGDRP